MWDYEISQKAFKSVLETAESDYVRIVSSSTIKLSLSERLDKIGIPYDSLNVNEIDNGEEYAAIVGDGTTSSFFLNDQLNTIVFVRDFLDELNEQDGERYVLMLMVLVHELMHSKDMKKQINFKNGLLSNTTLGGVVNAEVYAEYHTIKWLGREGGFYADVRDYYAFLLLTRASSNKAYGLIVNRVSKKIGEKKLLKWACQYDERLSE
jgi:hypothetical protein